MSAANQLPKPVHEIADNGRHRLVAGSVCTLWAPYTEFVYLNGWVGATAYYGKEGVMSPDEFLKSGSYYYGVTPGKPNLFRKPITEGTKFSQPKLF